MKKPLILTFNLFYLPGYRAGGPIRTLANMVDRLGDEFDFRIVTLDRDMGDSGPYPSCDRGNWGERGKAKVMYLAAVDISVRRLASIVNQLVPDVIYLNSFFDPTFTLRVLVARLLGLIGKVPVVLAPRGEFSEGALQLKWAKKKTYLQVSAWARLYHGLKWQASSEHERADILRSLPFVSSGEVYEALDLAPVWHGATGETYPRQSSAPMRVCFLSRISPMKNLDFALRALAEVKSTVIFTIYGPKEVPGYWAECEALIASLPGNVKIDYGGEVVPIEVRRSLAQHDLFFFPTRGENYGHVIHEALGAGLPVLISDQTPWGELEARGVGWAISLGDTSAFARIIDEVAGWSDERFQTVRKLATEYADESAAKPKVLEANRRLFLDVIVGARP